MQVVSICTALFTKKVNKPQYCLRLDLLSLMVNGPDMATPQCVNGAASQHLSFDKSDIFWSPNFPCIFLYVTHLWIILRTTALALSTQMLFFLRLFRVNLPSTMTHSFTSPNNFYLCNITSLWQSNWMWFITSQFGSAESVTNPNTPLLSRKGSSLNNDLSIYSISVNCTRA